MSHLTLSDKICYYPNCKLSKPNSVYLIPFPIKVFRQFKNFTSLPTRDICSQTPKPLISEFEYY